MKKTDTKIPEDFGTFKQERQIRRITFKTLLKDIADTFNLEKGIIFTVKELILRPGKSIQDYLGMGRFRYMNPLKFLILTVALAVFFTSYLNVFDTAGDSTMTKSFFLGLETGYENAGGGKREVLEKLTSFDYKNLIYENMNILLFMSLPISALFSHLFLSKKRFNYSENLALNAFIIGVQNLIYITFVLEMKLYSSNIWVGLFVLLTYGYLIYVYVDFFKLESLGGILKMFLAILLGNIFATILNMAYFIFLVSQQVKS